MVKTGGNAVGAILADGWYAGYVGLKARHNWGDKPRLLVQIEIEYENGSIIHILSDTSWKAAYGPIREADLIHGEKYDAGFELGDWDYAGFDDSEWEKVVSTKNIEIILGTHPGPRVRKVMELKAKKLKSPGYRNRDIRYG